MDYRRYQVKNWLPKKERSALLVIDMQNYFEDLAWPIVENVNALISAFKGASRPVIFTQHTHRDLDTDGGMLVEWWGRESMEAFIPGRKEWRLMNTLLRKESDPVVGKSRYSAFVGTPLEAMLKKAGVKDVVICGVMTNYCCETTARDAFCRDFRVFFVADATATDDPALHAATLCNLASGFAVVLETKRVVEAITAQRA